MITLKPIVFLLEFSGCKISDSCMIFPRYFNFCSDLTLFCRCACSDYLAVNVLKSARNSPPRHNTSQVISDKGRINEVPLSFRSLIVIGTFSALVIG